MFRQLLLFPDSHELIPSKAIRPTQFRLLVELECGFIGYLTLIQRALPAPDQLQEIESTLSEGISQGYQLTHIADLVCHRHGLSVEPLDTSFADITEWGIEKIVQATLAASISQTAGRDMAQLRDHLYLSTRSRLEEQLNRFTTALDTQILSALPKEALRPSRYNYLAGGTPTLNRNRMQAHRHFPWLMPFILWNRQLGHLPTRIQSAIDGGHPLIDLMAKGLGTTPSVIKSMMHCPLELISTSWQGSVKQLAACLDSITPEYRPQSPAAWARMGSAVNVIEKGTGQSITRPQNQLWLAASARRGFDMKGIEQDEVVALTQGLADMTNALNEVLAMRIGGADSWHAGWSSRHVPTMEAIRTQVSRAMSHVEFRKLLDLVRRWQDAFRRQQSMQDADSELIRGLTWRAPLDTFSTESRVIVPLLSQADLIEEGRAMNHCIGGYTCDCRLGELQVWSIRTLDGKRCSTLATRFKRSPNGKWIAIVNDHRGHSNVAPDQSARQAAHDLMSTLSATDADMRQFWEWRRTLAQLSVKERGVLIATRVLERSLLETLPRKLSLDTLESDIRQSIGARTKPIRHSAHESNAPRLAT